MSNPVPNFPDFHHGQPRLLEVMRRLWEVAWRADNVTATDMLAAVSESGIMLQGPESNGFWAKITGKYPGRPNYTFAEMQDSYLRPPNTELDYKLDGIVATADKGLYAEEVNFNQSVPIGAIAWLRLADGGDHWEFTYPHATASPGTGNGDGSVTGGSGGPGSVAVFLPCDTGILGELRLVINPDTGQTVLVGWNGTEWVVFPESGHGLPCTTATPAGLETTLVASVCPVEVDRLTPAGSDTLDTNYDIVADDTWEDTGLSVTLPAAADYLLSAQVIGEGLISAGTIGTLDARLYNVTGAASVPGSVLEIGYTETLDQVFRGTHTHAPIPFTSPVVNTVVRLEAFRNSGPTWDRSTVVSKADGGTRLAWQLSPEQTILTPPWFVNNLVSMLIPGGWQRAKWCDPVPECDCDFGCSEVGDTLCFSVRLPVPEGCDSSCGTHFEFSDTLTRDTVSGNWLVSDTLTGACGNDSLAFAVAWDCGGGAVCDGELSITISGAPSGCDTVYSFSGTNSDVYPCSCKVDPLRLVYHDSTGAAVAIVSDDCGITEDIVVLSSFNCDDSVLGPEADTLGMSFLGGYLLDSVGSDLFSGDLILPTSITCDGADYTTLTYACGRVTEIDGDTLAGPDTVTLIDTVECDSANGDLFVTEIDLFVDSLGILEDTAGPA